MRSSIRNLHGVLWGFLRSTPEAARINVVFMGKVKPVELTLVEVLDNGVRASDTEGVVRLYPFTAIASIELIAG